MFNSYVNVYQRVSINYGMGRLEQRFVSSLIRYTQELWDFHGNFMDLIGCKWVMDFTMGFFMVFSKPLG